MLTGRPDAFPALMALLKVWTNLSTAPFERLASFLLTYRTTPHATTGEMPCQLFMGRKLRTRLDLLRPAVDRRVCGKQADQKVGHDRHAKLREVWVGQQVMARNWRPGPMWVPGVVTERLAPLTYLVQVQSGQLWRCHVDKLRLRSDTPAAVAPLPLREEISEPVPVELECPETPASAEQPNELSEPEANGLVPGEASSAVVVPVPPNLVSPNESRRYPSRVRKPVDRYM